jgi:hypothetical protein
MTQIPIVAGVYADTSPDFRTQYPVNLTVIPKPTGISDGYLRIADGIVSNGTGPGVTRGGIEWNSIEYRVMGTKLVSVTSDGVTTTLGDVGGAGDVSMTYSFDYLAIASGLNLFLYNGTTLVQVTDADLGNVLDVVWIGGYFMTTDGTSLVVTELNDPFSVNPLKYGSSEVDPDPVVGLISMRNEVYAINRNTIEVFRNIGGDLFPFQRVTGGQIERGAVGTHCAVAYLGRIAFMGGNRNEAVSVRMGISGSDTKISTREIDLILAEYSEAVLAQAFMEVRSDNGNDVLIIHLPDRTLCFDGSVSTAMGVPIWYELSSAIGGGAWDARHLVWINNKWSVGRTTGSDIGYLSRSVFTHWGAKITWSFGVPILYNESRGVQVHELELVVLTGSAAFGSDPVVTTQHSSDGVVWSQAKNCRVGTLGDRSQRVRWSRCGTARNWRAQRFFGDSGAPLSIARLEARIEALAW